MTKKGTIAARTAAVKRRTLTCKPKVEMSPNAQSRNVTYLRRMQSSPRRSRACMEFSVKSKSLQGCDLGTGPRFCFGRAAAHARFSLFYFGRVLREEVSAVEDRQTRLR
jgi:hypothetical protein